jgi:hypothetical protein
MFRFSGLQCELLRVGVFLSMSWSSPELLCIMVFPSLSLLLGSIAQSGLVSPKTLMEALYVLWLATGCARAFSFTVLLRVHFLSFSIEGG